MSGPGLCGAVSGTDPLKDNLPLLRAAPEDDSPAAAFTAGLVNELSDEIRKILEAHPINAERVAQVGLAWPCLRCLILHAQFQILNGGAA